MIEFLSAVLLVSKDPLRLVRFYRDVLGLPIRDESHDESEPHFGCELGDVHFAIHPPGSFEGQNPTEQGSIRLAFTVFDMPAFIQRLHEQGVTPLYEPRDVGFALMTALKDPDGNYLEFTQLGDRWFQHLEKRRTEGADMLTQWKSHKKTDPG